MPTQYNITEDDYIQAAKLNGRIHARHKRWYYLIGGSLLIAGGLLFYFEHPIWTFALWGAVAGGVIFPLTMRYVVYPPMLRRNYRNYSAIQKPGTINVTDDGIELSAADTEGLLRWADIFAWRENRHVLLVFLAPGIYHIIPQSIVDEGFDLSALVDKLVEHVGTAI